eukprot:TRINITY_DN45870_c0_g1_i1.p1 TRINITY_DN45870_c0_g1~~TRINITY_DN45870_c0_g1_i1.p1  ORF type:complete len:1080 (+),score=188.17 TRINITY_DN45870_c0_g1_i1:78-3317(+)
MPAVDISCVHISEKGALSPVTFQFSEIIDEGMSYEKLLGIAPAAFFPGQGQQQRQSLSDQEVKVHIVPSVANEFLLLTLRFPKIQGNPIYRQSNHTILKLVEDEWRKRTNLFVVYGPGLVVRNPKSIGERATPNNNLDQQEFMNFLKKADPTIFEQVLAQARVPALDDFALPAGSLAARPQGPAGSACAHAAQQLAQAKSKAACPAPESADHFPQLPTLQPKVKSGKGEQLQQTSTNPSVKATAGASSCNSSGTCSKSGVVNNGSGTSSNGCKRSDPNNCHATCKEQQSVGEAASSTDVSLHAPHTKSIQCLCPNPQIALACPALFPKWNAGDIFTIGPKHLLRKAMSCAAPLLHHVVKAHMQLPQRSKSELKFQLLEKRGRHLKKEQDKSYGISCLSFPEYHGEDKFLKSWKEFDDSPCREVWDVSRLLDHIVKQNHFYMVHKTGSKTGPAKPLAIRNFCHRPYLRHARGDPERCHLEVLEELHSFLDFVLNFVSDAMLERLKNKSVDTTLIEDHREVFKRLRNTCDRMERMRDPPENLNIRKPLQSLAQQIRENIHEQSVSRAVLSILGPRFEQEDKLEEVEPARQDDDDGFRQKISKKQNAFKEGKDFSIPVLSRAGEVKHVIHDPLAVTHQDLVHDGFDALSLVLWDCLNNFGQKYNFMHKAFEAVKTVGTDKNVNCNIPKLMQNIQEEKEPAQAFQTVSDPAMLLTVVERLSNGDDASHGKHGDDADDGWELCDLSELCELCKKLRDFCYALNHHILDDEEEQLKAPQAAKVLTDMLKVAKNTAALCSLEWREWRKDKPEVKLLEMLQKQLEKFNRKAGQSMSNYGKFRSRGTLKHVDDRKALSYPESRLIPNSDRLPADVGRILAAQIARLPKKYLGLCDEDTSDVLSGVGSSEAKDVLSDKESLKDMEDEQSLAVAQQFSSVPCGEATVNGSAISVPSFFSASSSSLSFSSVLISSSPVSSGVALHPPPTSTTSSSHLPKTKSHHTEHDTMEPKDSIHPTVAAPANWGVAEVAEWLATLGFSQYCQTFKDAAVDGYALKTLSENDLKNELGVGIFGHRRNIATRIEHLFSVA